MVVLIRLDVRPHQLFTTSEAWKYLNVSESTFRRWMHTGYVSGIKIGGRWRFPADSICAMVGILPPREEEIEGDSYGSVEASFLAHQETEHRTSRADPASEDRLVLPSF